MNFQEFCFAQQEPSWNHPSPGYDSTRIESNDIQPSNISESDSETDQNSKFPPTTKLIRKRYDPIRDGDRIIRFEDNPAQYRKARKYKQFQHRKIQNRISATKVRGKKKTQTEELESEVNNLKHRNSELLLLNAKLQAENNMLKERVVFLEKVVLSKNQQQADSYISTGGSSPQHQPSEFESPFEDGDNKSVWSRVSGGNKSAREWTIFTVMTIVLAVMVMPGNSSPNKAMIATHLKDYTQTTANSTLMAGLNDLYQESLQFDLFKWCFKGALIALYIGFIGFLVLKKMGLLNSKLKRF